MIHDGHPHLHPLFPSEKKREKNDTPPPRQPPFPPLLVYGCSQEDNPQDSARICSRKSKNHPSDQSRTGVIPTNYTTEGLISAPSRMRYPVTLQWQVTGPANRGRGGGGEWRGVRKVRRTSTEWDRGGAGMGELHGKNTGTRLGPRRPTQNAKPTTMFLRGGITTTYDLISV